MIHIQTLDKKWMLQSYAGKKISQIMKKTTVAFISLASCIHHCFFSFWICLWWCQMLTPSDLRQPVQYFQGSALATYNSSRLLVSISHLSKKSQCPWLSPSIVNLATLHSAVRFKYSRVGLNPFWSGGYCFSPGCCCSEGSSLPEQDGCCYGGWLSTRSQRLLSHFSPQSHCPQSLLKSLYPLCPAFASDLLSLAISFSCSYGH